MATLTDIREGLAANLAAIAGVEVSAYMLASPTPPCLHVFPAEVDYDEAMQGGLMLWTLKVQAMVDFTTDQGSQETLDELLAPAGAMSVKAAIEADKTLGGAALDTAVTDCTGYQVYVTETSGAFLGAEWAVAVATRQT